MYYRILSYKPNNNCWRSTPHTNKTKRRRARNKAARASRKRNRI